MSSTSPSFIGEYFIDESVCDRLIDFFHKTPDQPNVFVPGTNHQHWYSKMPGKVGSYDSRIEKGIKDSIDLTFTTPIMYSHELSPQILPFYNILWLYLSELKICMDKYAKDYPHSAEHLSQIKEGINLQYYPPGGGYPNLHCERSGSAQPYINRHLVFMTYLNTVTDKGGTYFKHQDTKINAVKGKTVIWPSDWTHMHQGVVSPTQEKYIMTGWISHTTPDNIWVNNYDGVQLMLDL